MSFGVALDLMKEGLISTNQFLIASVVPPFTLYLWTKNRRHGLPQYSCSNSESLCVNAIMEMEETLFKTNGKDVRWPIVQLYRNLLVVLVSTFILNPLYRLLAPIPVFLMFVIHDKERDPYKHPFLNQLQTLFSAAPRNQKHTGFSYVFELRRVE